MDPINEHDDAEVAPVETPTPAKPARALSRREQVEAKRAARKEVLQKEADEQIANDLEAISELEVTLGDTNVTVLEIEYSPGLPARSAARTPNEPEIKRYRYRLKKKAPNSDPDTIAAAEELASVCRIYPVDDEVYAQMCAARPGIHAQLGVLAARLALGREESEGKA